MAETEEQSIAAQLEEILPFEGGGSFPVQYEVDVGNTNYYVRYRGSWLTIEKNHEEVFEQCLNPANDGDGEWSDEETTVYLYLISGAIRSGDFGTLALPSKDQVKSHPLYVPGPQPVYVFLNCTEDHEHDLATCPVKTASPIDLANIRKKSGAKPTLAKRILLALKRLF